METLRELVIILRKKQGIRQKDMAELMGMKHSSYSRLERNYGKGNKGFSELHLRKIEKILGGKFSHDFKFIEE